MDNSSDTVLTKKLLFVLKVRISHFGPSGRHLYYYMIKNTPSDAESHEEQDGNKRKFVGGPTAKLWPDLDKGVVKNTEEK